MLDNVPSYITEEDKQRISEVVSILPESGIFLELGPYWGKSTTYWADEFRKQNKKYQIHTCDIFVCTPNKVVNFKTFGKEYHNLIHPFMTGSMNHHETFKILIADYPEITAHVYDLYKNIPSDIGLDSITCFYNDAKPNLTDGVRKCFYDFYSIIEDGGVYCGRDYADYFPHIVDEVDSISKEMNFKINLPPSGQSSLYYFLKNESNP